jgi:pilus assembly protein CpaE
MGSVAARHPLSVVLTGGNDADRAQVRTILTGLIDPRVDVVEASNASFVTPKNGSYEILVALLDGEPETWAKELTPLVQQRTWALVIGVTARRTPDAVRSAMEAGAAEVLFLPADAVDVARCLLKVSEKGRPSIRSNDGSGLALVSVSGGVGVSSLTIALAIALRRLTKKQVALVDLGLQCNALSSMLDLDPEHTIAELIDPTSPIDSIRLESVLSKHPSGLYLLGAPGKIEEAEMVSSTTVDATLALMRQVFDFLLVDCGHHINEGSVAAWERTGNVFYVVDQSITSVRCAHRFLDLFDRLHLKNVNLQIVLNRFAPEHPVSIEKIEKALRRPIAFRIPFDPAAFAAAEDGQAVLPAGSIAAKAIESFARTILGPPYLITETNGRSHHGGILTRVLSAVGL